MKKNNKGFSLVELIIVIAIMAILIGVLAPQYIRYVEKSRISKDETTIERVVTAVKAFYIEESIDSMPTDATVTISSTGTTVSGGTTTATEAPEAAEGSLEAYLVGILGDLGKIRLTSKEYTNGVAVTATSTVNNGVDFVDVKWTKNDAPKDDNK